VELDRAEGLPDHITRDYFISASSQRSKKRKSSVLHEEEELSNSYDSAGGDNLIDDEEDVSPETTQQESLSIPRKRVRLAESALDESASTDTRSSPVSQTSNDDVEDVPAPLTEFGTLPPSKNPCLDALAYCVVMGYGADQSDEDERNHTISISDCKKLLAYVKTFCPKQTQTNNDEYRIKALKRWFNDLPTKKMRNAGNAFVIKMKADRRRAIERVIRRMQVFCKTGEDIGQEN